MNDFATRIKKLQRRKIIYIIVASLLILLNILTDLLSLVEGKFDHMFTEPGFGIGYLIGSHIFFIFGLFLFYRIYRINRRIQNLKAMQLDVVIDEIGTEMLK